MNDVEKVRTISEIVLAHAPRIIVGLVLIGIAVLAAFLIRSILRRVFRKFVWGPRVGTLISTTVFYGILILGILTGLGTMGVNMIPIIASLGLGGFALGFALRDALSNLLAGVLITVYQPFKEGDTISVSGCQGTVTEINLRYTVLENELDRFMVPNSLIFTKPLKITYPEEENKRP
jgi:small-conductance mechanosensitive channel